MAAKGQKTHCDVTWCQIPSDQLSKGWHTGQVYGTEEIYATFHSLLRYHLFSAVLRFMMNPHPETFQLECHPLRWQFAGDKTKILWVYGWKMVSSQQCSVCDMLNLSGLFFERCVSRLLPLFISRSYFMFQVHESDQVFHVTFGTWQFLTLRAMNTFWSVQRKY